MVDTAYGRPVHAEGVKTVPPIFVAAQHGPTGAEDADGPPDWAPPDMVPAATDAREEATAGTGAEQAAETVSRAADGGTNGAEPTPGAGAPQLPPPAAGPWPPASAPSRWPGKQSPWPPPPPPPTSR